MSSFEAVLRRLDRDLGAQRVCWELIGGFAVSARAEPRFTRVLDVAVAVADDQAAEALAGALLREGYRVMASVEQDDVGRLATVRLHPPGEPEDEIVTDLLFASSGIEPEIVAAAGPVVVAPGLTVPVARIGHLIALKLLSRDDERRPLDAADLLALRAVADSAELDLAQEAVELIHARGYDRGRDLGAALGHLR